MNVKRKTDVIRETAEFYNLNNRGVDGNGHYHYLTDDKKCGVGRCMTDEALQRSLEGWPSIGSFVQWQIGSESYLKIFKPQYKIDDIQFWEDIQGFHDVDDYWNETGLSAEGKKKYQRLLDKYLNQ